MPKKHNDPLFQVHFRIHSDDPEGSGRLGLWAPRFPGLEAWSGLGHFHGFAPTRGL